jgi:hypothetical protein
VSLILLLIVALLPWFASLRGKGDVWKFLSLLFCCLSVWAALTAGFLGWILTWVVAWIFAGIAQQGRQPKDVLEVAPAVPPLRAAPPPPPPPTVEQREAPQKVPRPPRPKGWAERAGADFSHGRASLFIMIFVATALLVYVVMK